MTPPPSRVLTDLTWVGLMVATALAWLVFEGTVDVGAVASTLMALMLIKSVLILAVFMDLARSSVPMLVGLTGFMVVIAVGVAVQI